LLVFFPLGFGPRSRFASGEKNPAQSINAIDSRRLLSGVRGGISFF
jgi:hypothetical protein